MECSGMEIELIKEKYRDFVIESKKRDYFSDNELKFNESELLYGNVSQNHAFCSIIIPTYNRFELLKRCVDSAIKQKTSVDYEIVIVDNNPSNVNNQLIKDYLEGLKFDNIKYYVNKENLGAIGNWNRGFQLAQGDWLAMLHDDDMLHPNWLEELGKIAKSVGDSVVAIGTNLYRMENDNQIKSFLQSNIKEIRSYRNIDSEKFKGGIACPILGALIRKTSYYELQGFGNTVDFIEDYIFMTRLSFLGELILTDTSLYGYWEAETSDSSSDGIWDAIIVSEYFFTKQLLSKLNNRYLVKTFYPIYKTCSSIIRHNCLWMGMSAKTSKKVDGRVIRLNCNICYPVFIVNIITAFVINIIRFWRKQFEVGKS